MRRTTCAPKRRTRRCVPDQPGTMPSAGLGQAELDLRLGDADVGGGGQFQAAAERMAVERGDHRHAQPRQPVEDAVAVAHPGVPEIERRQPRPGLDVAAGAEAPCLRR